MLVMFDGGTQTDLLLSHFYDVLNWLGVKTSVYMTTPNGIKKTQILCHAIINPTYDLLASEDEWSEAKLPGTGLWHTYIHSQIILLHCLQWNLDR